MSSSLHSSRRYQSVHGLTSSLAPGEPVFRALQANHPNAMVVRVASRTPRYNNKVTGFQRVPRDTLDIELSSAAPFNGITDRRPVLLFDHHMNERVRIAV